MSQKEEAGDVAASDVWEARESKKRKGPQYFNTETGKLGGSSFPGKQRCTVAAYVRWEEATSPVMCTVGRFFPLLNELS